MTIKWKPMTKAALKQFILAYRPVFEGWTFLPSTGYVRISGPVAQHVWFENLRSGAYRPATAISVLPTRGGSLLHQFLDFRYREVTPLQHPSMFENVCRAMKEQFTPSIVTPLEPEEVLRLAEAQSQPRINDGYFLSSLNAYLQKFDAAKKWIDVVRQIANSKSEFLDWEKERISLTLDLERQIHSGNAVAFLEGIRQGELKSSCLIERTRFKIRSWGS
jgi:hypothetical protein